MTMLADEWRDGYISAHKKAWFVLLTVEQFLCAVLKDKDEHSPRFYAKMVGGFPYSRYF